MIWVVVSALALVVGAFFYGKHIGKKLKEAEVNEKSLEIVNDTRDTMALSDIELINELRKLDDK